MSAQFKPAQLAMLDRAVRKGGTIEVVGNEWPSAQALHGKGFGVYYPAERRFEINEAGRAKHAELLAPRTYRDEPCLSCGALATTAVSGKRLCRKCAGELLTERLDGNRGGNKSRQERKARGE